MRKQIFARDAALVNAFVFISKIIFLYQTPPPNEFCFTVYKYLSKYLMCFHFRMRK